MSLNPNLSDHREKLLSNSTQLVDDIKGLLSNISSKDTITASAQACAKTLQDIVAEVKAGSASLGPQLQDAQEKLSTHQTKNPYFLSGVPPFLSKSSGDLNG